MPLVGRNRTAEGGALDHVIDDQVMMTGIWALDPCRGNSHPG